MPSRLITFVLAIPILGCQPGSSGPSEPNVEVTIVAAQLARDGATLSIEFNSPVTTVASSAEAFRLSRIAHSDEHSVTTTWYTDISLVTCIAGRLQGLNGTCDPGAIPPTLLGGESPGEPTRVVTLNLLPAASSAVLDIVCGEGGTLDAFCADNPTYTACSEFVALHHTPGDSATFSDATLGDLRGDWVRGLQTREPWFMEFVTPGEGPDGATVRITCAE